MGLRMSARTVAHVDPHKLSYAAHLRAATDGIAEIVAKPDITRTILYRHMPPQVPSKSLPLARIASLLASRPVIQSLDVRGGCG